jgi:hypothetical protein
MSIHTYDHWKSTNPADEFLGPAPEDEEFAEPIVEEIWDGDTSEYIHVVIFESGRKFFVLKSRGGAFIGDYEIVGPGDFYRDGYTSVEKALEYLTDIEHWGW